MKTRNGFVSNSSSSSFIIYKEFLSPFQIQAIYDHVEFSKEQFGWDDDCAWSITENEETIEGSTYMDNFPMDEFLEKIGVHAKYIKWEY